QFANGYNGLLRAGSIGMVSFLSFTIFTVSGQAFQSESEQTFEALTRQKWYNWNQKNKKMLLLALCNSREQFKIKFSEKFVINYDAGVAVGLFF
ncbi:unnamed protein product, partial [Tenebrio molitor]